MKLLTAPVVPAPRVAPDDCGEAANRPPRPAELPAPRPTPPAHNAHTVRTGSPATAPSRRPATALAVTAAAISAVALLTTSLPVTGPAHRNALGHATTGLAYLLLGALAFGFVRHYRVRLHWTRGGRVPAAMVGLATGGGLGLVLVLRAVTTGQASFDPVIGQQWDRGSASGILFGVVLPIVLAPIVEEVVFRGLLAESMLRSGLASAVTVSASAFWLWHWQLSAAALVYLGALGAVLTVVYARRGLLASIVAHAAFNAVLVAAVIAQLSAPGRTVHAAGGVTLRVPTGWSTVRASDGFALQLTGPSDAQLAVLTQRAPGATSADNLEADARVRAAQLSQGAAATDIHLLDLPAGPAVSLTVTLAAHHIRLVELAVNGELYQVVVDDRGDRAADIQAAQMLASLRIA